MIIRSIAVFVFLFALWLLMSGVYKPLVIGLGAASALFSVYILRRMDALDGVPVRFVLGPVRFLGYVMWLLVEIAKCNWNVTKAILAPNMNLRQHFFGVPNTQKSEVGAAVFANSITLTPGTITIEVEADRFLVHALNYSEDDDAGLADMDARVSHLEKGI